MLITVSGPAGSGKSTLAGNLADALDYEHVSGGDIFRDLAEDRGMTPLELNKAAEEDDQIDRDLDRRLRDIAAEREDLVLESRLAGWMAGEHADMKLWLTAPLDARAGRIAEREEKSVEQARTETEERSESEAQRYAEYYDIDFADLSIYDLAINTARWDPEGTLNIALNAVDAYDAAVDEGKTPVEGIRYEF
ncbi:(d)CMP kinase [Haloarcula salinisoli]|uniref:Cytidylate kinase n=1 Tax=Haloarcula salinisoli TaxID=2487746 RepID=A0A8J8C929_9EURY|nr:AAA family ATPase [Halomicroarcula salinisoli]MBX0287266.1 AAA family ATPase [Halomicroarcula salinisoli]MBX0305171.1 AAA family ATPase [Halomicroarcula salinisoli]